MCGSAASSGHCKGFTGNNRAAGWIKHRTVGIPHSGLTFFNFQSLITQQSSATGPCSSLSLWKTPWSRTELFSIRNMSVLSISWDGPHVPQTKPKHHGNTYWKQRVRFIPGLVLNGNSCIPLNPPHDSDRRKEAELGARQGKGKGGNSALSPFHLPSAP